MSHALSATFIRVVFFAVTASFASTCFADDVKTEVRSAITQSAAACGMSLMLGVGLSAASGFRVFVPFLGISIASFAGHLTLAPGFEWIGSWPGLLAFATATILEIAIYFVPWIDNITDAFATPLAIVAGTILTASQIGEMSHLLQWSLAIIAGGGVCGVVQMGTVAIRAVSTGTTGGFGNFLVATFELIAAVVVTVLAIVLPVVGIIAVVWITYKMLRKIIASKSMLYRKPQAVGA